MKENERALSHFLLHEKSAMREKIADSPTARTNHGIEPTYTELQWSKGKKKLRPAINEKRNRSRALLSSRVRNKIAIPMNGATQFCTGAKPSQRKRPEINARSVFTISKQRSNDQRLTLIRNPSSSFQCIFD
jgi:hypothetical protein